MIISHEHKFIFIKTRKTAGTSIEVFLSQHCGEDDVVTPIHPPVESHRPRNFRGLFNPLPELVAARSGLDAARSVKHFLMAERFYNHMPAWIVKRRLPPEIWNSYFKFCVERNPWDKVLSYYHMLSHQTRGKLSLAQYVQRGRFPVDHALYTDEQGNLMVDQVVRYENLAEELGAIFASRGIPFTGTLGVRAKGGYREDRRPYQEVFSPEQGEIIANAFATEIALLKYSF